MFSNMSGSVVGFFVLVIAIIVVGMIMWKKRDKNP